MWEEGAGADGGAGEDVLTLDSDGEPVVKASSILQWCKTGSEPALGVFVEGKHWVAAPSVLCFGFSGQPSPCPQCCTSFCAARMLPPELLVVENTQWQRDHETFGCFACGTSQRE